MIKLTQRRKLSAFPIRLKLIEMEDLTIRKKFDRKVLHLVYVGRIDLAKGLKEIVRALESMADISYYFHIVGDGPDMPEFTKILSALPEANYKLYGVKTLDEIYKILAGCQVFYNAFILRRTTERYVRGYG